MKTLHWKHKRTGATGHGKPLPDKIARDWLAAMENSSEFEYWLETAVTSEKAAEKEPT